MSALDIDPRQFRNALGAFTTGVTIVTTRDRAGEDIGVTVNSFSSVSLDPPLVLWSLARNAASLAAFIEADHFAVHVLAADQEALSNRFARRGTDKFAGLRLARGHGGVPLIDGCAARFQCRMAYRYAGGDHEILVGEVINFEQFDCHPLVFHRGKYVLALKKDEIQRIEDSPELDLEIEQNALNVLLGMAYHQLMQRMGPALARHKLTEEEYWVVNMVGARQGRSLNRLNKLLAFSGKRIAQDTIDDLCARGVVERAGEEIHMTPEGRRVLIEMAAVAKAVEQDAEEGLDYGEAQLLRQLLQRVIRASRPRA